MIKFYGFTVLSFLIDLNTLCVCKYFSVVLMFYHFSIHGERLKRLSVNQPTAEFAVEKCEFNLDLIELLSLA